MVRRDIDAKIDLLQANVEKLAKIPQTSEEEFLGDFRNLESALHLLQVSIQALIDIGTYVISQRGLAVPATSHAILETLESAGLLPPDSTRKYGPVFGFRNRIVHLYDRIDPSIVYRILHDRRGDLRSLLDLLIAALED